MSLLLNVGHLIDGTGVPPLRGVSVLVDGARIAAIGPQGTIPNGGATLIDAPDCTLVPGLFDLHSHMSLLLEPIESHADQSLRRDDLVATRVFKAALGAKMWLQTGVTTIRHAGSGDNFAVAMKEAIAEGWTPGPRVFASGSLIAQTGGVRPGNDRWVVEITGADEARRVARQQLKAGVDVLKIYGASSIGGGGGRLIGPPGWPQLTVEEMRAIVEEAHKPDRLASAHTGSAESIKNAVQAGVDWVDHADLMDEEAIEMLLESNTPVVPTMAIAWSLATFGEEMGFGKHIATKAAEVADLAKERLQKAYQAGVRLAVGTDADNPRATVAKECELLTEIGMSAMEAIVAATRTPAEILGVSDSLGTIEEGKIADLLIVAGDPLQDIRNLGRVEHVIQGGKVLELPLADLTTWGYA
jgi:imidazolonepropionase-like amidohydrolase